MARIGTVPLAERVWRCSYCGREIRRGAAARLENPRCEVCLAERLRRSGARIGAVMWVEEDGYMVPVPIREP